MLNPGWTNIDKHSKPSRLSMSLESVIFEIVHLFKEGDFGIVHVPTRLHSIFEIVYVYWDFEIAHVQRWSSPTRHEACRRSGGTARSALRGQRWVGAWWQEVHCGAVIHPCCHLRSKKRATPEPHVRDSGNDLISSFVVTHLPHPPPDTGAAHATSAGQIPSRA